MLRTTHFVGKTFTLRPTDLPLYGVPVQGLRDSLETRSYIEIVQAVRKAGRQTITRIFKLKRSELKVLPPLAITFSSQPIREYLEIVIVVEKGLTMVGKRQRHQPCSRDPTRDPAQNHTITQCLAWGCARQHALLIAIGASQGF
jgi:hypothetical protein